MNPTLVTYKGKPWIVDRVWPRVVDIRREAPCKNGKRVIFRLTVGRVEVSL